MKTYSNTKAITIQPGSLIHLDNCVEYPTYVFSGICLHEFCGWRVGYVVYLQDLTYNRFVFRVFMTFWKFIYLNLVVDEYFPVGAVVAMSPF